MIYGSDSRWWLHYIGDLMAEDVESELWTQNVQWEKEKPEAYGINCVTSNTSAAGLSTDPEVIHTGSNSGYAAINLALHRGAGRIILLGYDMCMEGEKRHFFGDHPGRMNVNSNYAQFLARYRSINPAAYGIEILNCSRRTAMTCFPCHDLDELHAAHYS